MKHTPEVLAEGSLPQQTTYTGHDSDDVLLTIAAVVTAAVIVGGNLFAFQKMIMGI